MSGTDLRIRTTADDHGRVVELTGEVDLSTSPKLRNRLQELIENYSGRLIIDLGGVAYMDSSGVGTLVELKRKLERKGGSVVLARPQPRVRSVFEITQLDKFFTITDSIDQARQT